MASITHPNLASLKKLFFRTLAIAVVIIMTCGFVRAPHPQWVKGEVVSVNGTSSSFTLAVAGKSVGTSTLTVNWDKQSRLFLTTKAHRREKAALNATSLKAGDHIQVQYRHFTDHNVATKVIRLAS